MSSAALTLRRARRAAGISQAELAQRAGVSQPVVARLERAGSNPSFETLSRMIRATGARLELRVAPSPGLDEQQILTRLSMPPAERLATFTASQRNLARLAARARHVEPHAS